VQYGHAEHTAALFPYYCVSSRAHRFELCLSVPFFLIPCRPVWIASSMQGLYSP
jgi:hypothetical protein